MPSCQYFDMIKGNGYYYRSNPNRVWLKSVTKSWHTFKEWLFTSHCWDIMTGTIHFQPRSQVEQSLKLMRTMSSATEEAWWSDGFCWKVAVILCLTAISLNQLHWMNEVPAWHRETVKATHLLILPRKPRTDFPQKSTQQRALGRTFWQTALNVTTLATFSSSNWVVLDKVVAFSFKRCWR